MDETMRRRVATHGSRFLAGLTLLFGVPGIAWAAGDASAPVRFPEVGARFEQNATDRDVEAVFNATGRKDGLVKLTVVAPDGHTVVDFTAPGASAMGIREFEFESPEPTDVEGLKAAYPAGVYRFAGTTAGGKELHGEATLSHELPATTSITRPGVKARNVPAKGLVIGWTPVAGVSGYVLELEQGELGVSILVHLPGSAASFAVPDDFLRPGMEYDLGIGTVSETGNVSFVETSFTTAE